MSSNFVRFQEILNQAFAENLISPTQKLAKPLKNLALHFLIGIPFCFGFYLGQNGFSETCVHIAPLLSPQSSVSSMTAKMHFLAKTSVIYTAAKGTPPTYQIGFIPQSKYPVLY